MSSIRRRLFPQERSEAAADAEVDPGPRVCRIGLVHVVPLLVGHHLERQLVVVPEEHRPLAVLRDRRSLLHDVDDREAVLRVHRHEEPRRRPGSGTPCGTRPRRRSRRWSPPATGLPRRGASGRATSRRRARKAFRKAWVSGRFSQLVLLARRGRDGVEPHAVDSHAEPEVDDREQSLPDRGIVEVEVRLVGVEPVPVVGLGHLVPGPVRRLEVLEDDPRVGVLVGGVAPDVEVPLGRSRRGSAGPLEPRDAGPTCD